MGSRVGPLLPCSKASVDTGTSCCRNLGSKSNVKCFLLIQVTAGGCFPGYSACFSPQPSSYTYGCSIVGETAPFPVACSGRLNNQCVPPAARLSREPGKSDSFPALSGSASAVRTSYYCPSLMSPHLCFYLLIISHSSTHSRTPMCILAVYLPCYSCRCEGLNGEVHGALSLSLGYFCVGSCFREVVLQLQ